MKLSLRNLPGRLRASPWFQPALRVTVALVGLVALACVGRAVASGGAVSPAQAAPELAAPTPSAPLVEAPVADASAALPAEASAVRHAARASPDDPVYLNEATVDDLRRLPGIGEKRALAILELRGKLGRFKQVDDLLRVKGIGRATLRHLRPLVRLDRSDGGAAFGA